MMRWAHGPSCLAPPRQQTVGRLLARLSAYLGPLVTAAIDGSFQGWCTLAADADRRGATDVRPTLAQQGLLWRDLIRGERQPLDLPPLTSHDAWKEVHVYRQAVETLKAPLMETVLRFPRPEGGLRPLSEVGDTVRGASAGPPSHYVVRPRLGSGDGPPPSQLLTLWSLVFGLSNLAWYYPAVWVQALDPDSSRAAITLEHGMEVALAKVPELLAPALSGSPLTSNSVRAPFQADATRPPKPSRAKNHSNNAAAGAPWRAGTTPPAPYRDRGEPPIR
jgi:hypothetical protein